MHTDRLMIRSSARGAWLWLCVFPVAFACASRVRGSEPQSAAEGGAAGEDATSAPDNGVEPRAGAAGRGENAGASGALDGANTDGESAGAAGAPSEPEPVAKRAASGTELCEDDLDCNEGLSCSGSTGRKNRACLAGCESDVDCKQSERCFGQNSIRKSCFHSCQESYTECAYQFDCADYYRANQYLCIPTEWVRNWPAQPAPGA